jgi:actin-related protein
VNWDLEKEIWSRVLKGTMGVSPRECSLLMTEPLFNLPQLRAVTEEVRASSRQYGTEEHWTPGTGGGTAAGMGAATRLRSTGKYQHRYRYCCGYGTAAPALLAPGSGLHTGMLPGMSFALRELSVGLSITQSVSQSVCRSVGLSVVGLSVCQSVSLSVFQSVILSVAPVTRAV